MASVGNASSAGGSSALANAAKPLSSSFADTRSYRVSATPRTCFECVNIALRSGEKVCRLTDSVKWLVVSSAVLYSSATHSYCERDDAVCSQCRATWYRELTQGVSVNLSTASPRVCVGSGGCVCLAFCEAFHRSNVTCVSPALTTTAPATTSPTQMASSQTGEPLGDYAWLIVLFALFVLVGIWSYQQTHVDENGAIQTSYRQLFRKKKREPPRGPFLSLSGWLGYHEKLIEEERAALSEGKTPLTKMLTQNGPNLPVQVGEGYHPASPSHAPRQQQQPLISICGM